jgi:hypothetical protein
MDGLSILYGLISFGPFLPCLAIISTGLTLLFLQILAAVSYEYLC